LKRRNNSHSNSEQLVDLTDIKSFDYYLPKLDGKNKPTFKLFICKHEKGIK
jgi:hypothetical protein